MKKKHCLSQPREAKKTLPSLARRPPACDVDTGPWTGSSLLTDTHVCGPLFPGASSPQQAGGQGGGLRARRERSPDTQPGPAPTASTEMHPPPRGHSRHGAGLRALSLSESTVWNEATTRVLHIFLPCPKVIQSRPIFFQCRNC